MQLHFDPHIAYECVQCGRGCFNRWDIEVEAPVRERLRSSQLELRVIQERPQAFVEREGRWLIAKDEQHPRCGFLQEDLLCSIHSQDGYAAKPLICQQYPYVMTQTPDGDIYVSAAYSCTAVREEIGPSLSESREAVEDLLARGGRVHRLSGPQPILDEVCVDWAELLSWEEEFLRRERERGWGATLELALTGVASVFPQQEAAEGWLATSWLHGSRSNPALKSQMDLLHTVLSLGLLKPCLDTQDREIWRGIDRALMEGGDLSLPEFSWEAPLADLQLWVAQGLGDKFDADIERYQRSLLFRKVHLTMGGLLPGLLLMWLKPSIIRLLTGLSAWRNQQEPQREDFYWALERAETCLVAHTFDTVPIYQRGARQLVAVSASFSL